MAEIAAAAKTLYAALTTQYGSDLISTLKDRACWENRYTGRVTWEAFVALLEGCTPRIFKGIDDYTGTPYGALAKATVRALFDLVADKSAAPAAPVSLLVDLLRKGMPPPGVAPTGLSSAGAALPGRQPSSAPAGAAHRPPPALASAPSAPARAPPSAASAAELARNARLSAGAGNATLPRFMLTPAALGAAYAVRDAARRRYMAVMSTKPIDTWPHYVVLEAMTAQVPTAGGVVIGGTVYVVLVRVTPPDVACETVLLRVWRRLNGDHILEGMVCGVNARPLRYLAMGTWEGC
jgi:hypothetical protein